MDENAKDKTPFHIWLQATFESWVSEQIGKGKGVMRQSDFADYVGISQNNLSQYILGKRRPDYEMAMRLAEKLGPQVFDRLDYPRVMPKRKDLYYVADHWHELEPHEAKEIVERIKNKRSERQQRQARKEEEEGPSFA